MMLAPSRSQLRPGGASQIGVSSRSVLRRSADPLAAGEPASARCACGGGCPQCAAVPSLQPPLLVGALDDPLEREADRIAERVADGATAF